MTAALRTLADVRAAGAAYGATMPPPTSDQAGLVAALLAPYWPQRPADAQAA